jgi:hypothetical protein
MVFILIIITTAAMAQRMNHLAFPASDPVDGQGGLLPGLWKHVSLRR